LKFHARNRISGKRDQLVICLTTDLVKQKLNVFFEAAFNKPLLGIGAMKAQRTRE